MKAFVVIAAAVVFAGLAVGAEDKPAASPAPKTVAPTEQKPGDIVARVGDHAITRAELDTTTSAMVKQFTAYGRPLTDAQMPLLRYDVLQQMVTHELALQEARGHEPADLDQQVQKQIDEAKLQAGGEEGFTNALAGMNVTLAEFTQRLRDDVIVRDRLLQLADASAKVTPEDARKFYDENRERMKMPERVRASHILIAVPRDSTDEVKKEKRTKIESVQTSLKNGEKFPDLARKYSEDPVSARAGGDLGFFTRGQMVPEFEAVAFSLKTNEISEIVVTKFGYHILLITEHQPAGERSFDEVKADIEKYLRSTKEQEIAAAHVKKLRDTSKYEILLPKPEPVAPTPPPTVATPPVKAMPTVETKPVAAPKP
jgi:peptidyl-prolyl cis-trans isomerase C